jgi:hypothetical protein
MHMHWFTAKTAHLLPQARQHDLVLMYRLLAMHLRVTCGTERDQVLLGIVSGLASVLFMVHLKAHPCAACLASPAIPPQNLSTECLYDLASSRRRGRFGRIGLTKAAHSAAPGMRASARPAGT